MQIRPATVDDYDAFARLMPELRVDDPIPSRDRFARDLHRRMVVAVRAGAVVGYALFEVLTDTGYVRNIVSDPALRRQGIGVAMMTELRRKFVEGDARTWCLNVKPDNHAAIALYRRFGLAPAYRSHALRLSSSAPPVDIPADLELHPVAVDEEAAVESATGLLPGQLASARSKPGRQAWKLERRGQLVGVAVFYPSFPGAFPFRVLDPGLGPAAMESMRAMAPAGSPWVQVVVEDDEALHDALVARGATEHMEILHMRGQLGP